MQKNTRRLYVIFEKQSSSAFKYFPHLTSGCLNISACFLPLETGRLDVTRSQTGTSDLAAGEDLYQRINDSKAAIGQYEFRPNCCGIELIRIYYDANNAKPGAYTMWIKTTTPGLDIKIRFED